jgi:dihydropteroate synthase
MQSGVAYADVCATVQAYLAERLAHCVAEGMDPGRLCLDPGFGFGKRPEDNLALLRRLRELAALQRPVLVGLSRKSWLAALTGRGVGERLAGSVALATIAVLHGALIVRAHDVAATVDAIRVAHAVAVPQS